QNGHEYLLRNRDTHPPFHDLTHVRDRHTIPLHDSGQQRVASEEWHDARGWRAGRPRADRGRAACGAASSGLFWSSPSDAWWRRAPPRHSSRGKAIALGFWDPAPLPRLLMSCASRTCGWGCASWATWRDGISRWRSAGRRGDRSALPTWRPSSFGSPLTSLWRLVR